MKLSLVLPRRMRGLFDGCLNTAVLVFLSVPMVLNAQTGEGLRPPEGEATVLVRPPQKALPDEGGIIAIASAEKPVVAAPLVAGPHLASFAGDPAIYGEAFPAEAQGIPFDVRPPARRANLPRTRWQHMPGHAVWTRAALSALKDHGKPLVDIVPRDIAQWCPAYPTNTDAKRRAFWVGYMSALAKHESTYKPWAVGGGGRWYGLLQILPATARGYKCNVGTGEALKNGAANLSCGVRIMAHTVNRDGVIHGRDGRWRGVSADWGPMRKDSKRRDMAGWLKRQSYCQMVSTIRPRARP